MAEEEQVVEHSNKTNIINRILAVLFAIIFVIVMFLSVRAIVQHMNNGLIHKKSKVVDPKNLERFTSMEGEAKLDTNRMSKEEFGEQLSKNYEQHTGKRIER
ncbi:hypothetical protein EHP00_1551 [Ecytonucleospora hepatopenaei]|uniref:Uncharacterized protein n=1 Tax=Ecytonucleospora hepatopenaei TaxID=646526 RepID=A0A1W0E7H6_9MICR|nr:hypothetical protein EHP00_1551 [Ecytonucleospora hepatopenaei]